MNHYEIASWLRLLLTPGIGRVTARKLLCAFGSPASVLEQSPAALAERLGPAQVNALLSEPQELASQVETTWAWLQADPDARRVIPLGDSLYPSRLLECEDPPLLLYAIASPQTWSRNLLNYSPCLAVVGSRNPTPQGTANAHQFASALAGSGLTIVSGLALGIDGAAHEGALEGAVPDGLATIAVVGTGLDRVYPGQHRALAHRITQQGVLLSEFALGTGPVASNFPQRNRIISGLSLGTLVVEAALKSGSLITARLAVEQGREVFAIPGSIHATQARGCHALIKEGAKLVECAQDVMDELTLDAHHSSAPLPVVASDAEPESALLQALGFDACSLDALQARTGLPTPALLAELMTLELQGLVARLPGGLYQRLVLA